MQDENKSKKFRFSIDLSKFFRRLFSKRYLISLIAIFFIYKGYMLYLYASHQIKATKAILKLEDLRDLCLENKNIDIKNESYFYQQQEQAHSAVTAFVTSHSFIVGQLFYSKDFADEDNNLYEAMLKQNFKHCPELLKSNTWDLQEQLYVIQDKMLHHVRFF